MYANVSVNLKYGVQQISFNTFAFYLVFGALRFRIYDKRSFLRMLLNDSVKKLCILVFFEFELYSFYCVFLKVNRLGIN